MITKDTDVITLLAKAKAALKDVLGDEIFTVKDLFRGLEWRRISVAKRLQLGSQFFDEVNKGIIQGIEPIGKTPRQQQRYRKLIPGTIDDIKGF